MADDTAPSSDSSGVEESDSHWSRWWILVGLVAVAAIAVGIVAFVNKKVEDTKVAWPESAGGRAPGLGEVNVPAPKVDVTAKPGVYAWSGPDGWHLWVVNGGAIGGVTGSITSDDELVKATTAVPKAGTVTLDGKTATLTPRRDPGLVGVDFQPGFYAKRLTFTVEGPDGPIPAKLITVGRHKAQVRAGGVVDKVQEKQASTS